ncbi:hypothetical protein [Nitrincola sp. MINF-07-Sa-05]|uniref:hypothetical protein n=1 Tax=Nitrincola salilacus TaxID=3400273 RepID=UPI003918084E
MDLNELAMKYYHASLALAQKALLAGLTVAAVAYLVAITGEKKESYLIPLIEIEVASLNYFSISLLILFFACGIACSYGISKALDNWELVTDKNLAFRLLHIPSLFMIGILADSALYGFIFTVGASLSDAMFGFSDWKSFVFGWMVTLPYLIAFRLSSDLRQLKKEDNNS